MSILGNGPRGLALSALILLGLLGGCDTSANEEKANNKRVRELVRGEGHDSQEQDGREPGAADAASSGESGVGY